MSPFRAQLFKSRIKGTFLLGREIIFTPILVPFTFLTVLLSLLLLLALLARILLRLLLLTA